MNKPLHLICLILIGIVALGVDAAQQKVIIFQLDYDNGNITYLNNTVKYGFYPDRRYQSEYGYKAEMLSDKSEVLYSFKFDIPNKIFVDGTNERGELSGGKIVMNETKFALTVPYFERAKEMRIYSPDNRLITNIPLKMKSSLALYSIIFLIIAGLMIGFFIFRKKKR